MWSGSSENTPPTDRLTYLRRSLDRTAACLVMAGNVASRPRSWFPALTVVWPRSPFSATARRVEGRRSSPYGPRTRRTAWC